jgi:hypothetical protein
MVWFGWGAVTLALLALTSPAAAAPQLVAGVEIDYSLPLQRDPEVEERVLEGAVARPGPRLTSVEVYRASLSWDIDDGQGHVQVTRTIFAAARDLDDAAREMSRFVTGSVGEVFKHSTSQRSVSNLGARQVSFERNLSGLRLGGEILVVADPQNKTIWQVQVLFARRPASANLDQDRNLALKILASIRVVERVGGKGSERSPPRQSTSRCTLRESEEKTQKVIHAIGDLKARDRAKFDRINRRFDEVFNRYLEPLANPNPQRQELHRHEFCRTLDELLAELKR